MFRFDRQHQIYGRMDFCNNHKVHVVCCSNESLKKKQNEKNERSIDF